MYKQPLLILSIAFATGIFVQDTFLLKNFAVYFLLVVSFLSLLFFFVRSFWFRRFRFFPLIFFFLALGLFAHSLNTSSPKLPELSASETIEFKISKKLNSNEKNRRYEIVAWKKKEFFLAVLSVPKNQPELDFLHYYKGSAYVNKLKKPYSSFQFDYAKYLARKDIYFQVYISETLSSAERSDLAFAEEIRQRRFETLKKIDQMDWNARTREFTKGIVLADRTEMDAETVQDFSKSGLTHILAISGSHMAIIFWLILLLLNKITPPRLRQYKIIAALLIIWVFAVFIDYGSSVVRSCIMISCYYIYVLLQRKPDLLHAMALAGFIILIADSHQLFDVGFQLSFLAVLGIFWLNAPILKYLPKPKNNLQNFLVNVVSVSLAAQIVTLPLVLFYFHQFSFISLLANLIVLPFSELLIIFALLMTVLTAFSLNFSYLNLVYDEVVTFVLKIIHAFAAADFAFFEMIPMSIHEVGVAFGFIYFLRFAIEKFSIKNSMRLLYILLMFVSLRVLLNYKANEIDEVLTHEYFKQKIISIKQDKQVKFVLNENDNLEKIQKYVIQPYLVARRTKNFEIETLPKEVAEIRIGNHVYKLKE